MKCYINRCLNAHSCYTLINCLSLSLSSNHGQTFCIFLPLQFLIPKCLYSRQCLLINSSHLQKWGLLNYKYSMISILVNGFLIFCTIWSIFRYLQSCLDQSGTRLSLWCCQTMIQSFHVLHLATVSIIIVLQSMSHRDNFEEERSLLLMISEDFIPS